MKHISTTRRILFTVTIIVAGYLVLELSALVLYRIINPELLSFREFQSDRDSIRAGFRREEVSAGGTKVWPHAFEVIHPYLGFVRDPDRTESYDEHGFYGPSPLNRPGLDGEVIVAVFGGSFADGMTRAAADILSERIGKTITIPAERVKVLNLAMGGYKQPQQLMALTYFLALGVRFDIVINIDGFNELALPLRENLPKGVFPTYPRAWFMRVRGLSDYRLTLMHGFRAVLQERRLKWAGFFSRTPFKLSAISNLVWRLYDLRLDREIARIDATIQEYQTESARGESYISTGPSFQPQSREEVFRFLVEVWENCSRQMDRICRANGIEYYHFLQPNQYFPGSKPIGPAERRIAVKRRHPYRKPVEQGYPLLIEGGTRLRNAGINFHSLAMIFKENDEILYCDDACHLNARGYRLVAEEIGRLLAERSRDRGTYDGNRRDQLQLP